ncbi:hypothetical protein V4100_001023 [Pseudomonas aeruginosa]
MKLRLLLIALASILASQSFAEYRLYIKINEPIIFKSSSEVEEPKPIEPTEPAEPAFDFSEFDGIGTIDAVDSAGYIDTTNIQSMWIQRALFKQYNDHLIYLLGNRKDLIENASVINIIINGDRLRCVIDYKEYITTLNQTIFGCSTTDYDGLKYSAGQKFNISFN